MFENPPRLAAWMLRRFLRRRDHDAVMGDFEEIYCGIFESRGRGSAMLWYWGQILRSFPAFLFRAAYWSLIMFRNTLKVTLRTIQRHKGFSFINIAGLSIGMGACLLISLWVIDELSYDRFHEHADRLYRVEADEDYNGVIVHRVSSPVPLAAALEREIPEVAFAARFSRFGGMQLRYADRSFFDQNIRATDPSFFRMFSFRLIEGDESAALKDPHSILVSERMAGQIFPGESPLGKVVLADNRFELTVTGVISNPPPNSTLQYDWIVPFRFVRDNLNRMPQGWADAISTYVRLRPRVDMHVAAGKITQLILGRRQRKSTIYNLMPLVDMRLHQVAGRGRVVGNIRYVYIFSIIAVIVLTVACINFMNLSTARSAGRAREIGVRKVVGARRVNLLRQFYGESFLYTLAGLILAVTLTVLLLPVFNSISGKNLTAAVLGRGAVPMVWLGVMLLTALAAGSYPALMMSAFRPVQALTGARGMRSGNSRLRRSLVVFQFALSVFLIIATAVVFLQTGFMKGKNPGYRREQLLLIPMRGDVGGSLPALKSELANSPDIQGVTAVSRRPTMIGDYARDVTWDGKDPAREVQFTFAAVDTEFTQTMGIDLVGGRDFSSEFATDRTEGFLINQAAARLMGGEQALGKPLSMLGRGGLVIGIIKDFHFQSLRRTIEPLALLLAPNPDWLGQLVVRLRPGGVTSGLDFVERTWKKTLPDYPFEYSFLDEEFGLMYRREDRMGRLLGYFAFLAVLVASLGLFGLVSFTAEQRTKEIGIRKVLGASAGRITLALCRDYSGLVLLAVFLAWPPAFLAARGWLNDFAYRIPLSAFIFLFSGLLALLIALATVGWQAHRAARTDPVEALRYE